VRVLEPRSDLDLAAEPLGAERRGNLGPQDLDRDLSAVLEILGEVHGRHATLAELPLDRIAVGEGGGESGMRVSQWACSGSLPDTWLKPRLGGCR
jgi:hypothetical protein